MKPTESPGCAELAPQLDLVAFDRAKHVARRKISLMRALNPIAILREVQRVLALAAEELDVDVPAAGEVGSRGGTSRQVSGCASGKAPHAGGPPRSSRPPACIIHAVMETEVEPASAAAPRPPRPPPPPPPERDPRFGGGQLLRHFFTGDVQLRRIPGNRQRRTAVAESPAARARRS